MDDSYNRRINNQLNVLKGNELSIIATGKVKYKSTFKKENL